MNSGSQVDPFDNTGLKTFLEEFFGNSTLKDFDEKCIALTTARRMSQKSDTHYDSMEFFDTKSYYDINKFAPKKTFL